MIAAERLTNSKTELGVLAVVQRAEHRLNAFLGYHKMREVKPEAKISLSATDLIEGGIKKGFLRNWKKEKGPFVLHQEVHQFSEILPEKILELCDEGSGVIYFNEVKDPLFLINGEQHKKTGNFWLMRVFVPGLDGTWMEENIHVLDSFNENKINLLEKNLLCCSEAKMIRQSEHVLSFDRNVDIIDDPTHLLWQATKKTIGSLGTLTSVDNVLLLNQLYQLGVIRHQTHMPDKPYFVVEKVPNQQNSLSVYDQILQTYVDERISAFNPDNNSNQRSLIEGSEQVAEGLRRVGKTGAVARSQTLSARTAEKRKQPHQTLEITMVLADGRVVQFTFIVPMSAEFNRFLNNNQEMTLDQVLNLMDKLLPNDSSIPNIPARIPNNTLSSDRPNVLPVVFGGAPVAVAAGAVFASPSLSIVPVFVGSVVASSLPATAIITSQAATEFLIGAIAEPAISKEKPMAAKTTHHEQILDESPSDFDSKEEDFFIDTIEDYPDVPTQPNIGPTGGGRRILPQEIKTTIWDKRMADKFQATRASSFVPHREWNSLDTAENHGEQVIFDDSKKEESEPKGEVIFHQYASDLEGVQAEKMTNVVSIEQENLSPLLLADIKEKTTTVDTVDLEVNKKYLEIESVYGDAEEQTENHYDTAPHHSKDESNNQTGKKQNPTVTERQLEQKTKRTQSSSKNTRRSKDSFSPTKSTPNDGLIPNALLVNYLFWREMFSRMQTAGPNTTDNLTKKNPEAEGETRQNSEAEDNLKQDNSFMGHTEKNKTQTKKCLPKQILQSKTKLKTRKMVINPAFLSLLLLTKIKLLTKVRLLAKKSSLANFTQLFVTDTLLLFLLNPKLFLVNKSTVAD